MSKKIKNHAFKLLKKQKQTKYTNFIEQKQTEKNRKQLIRFFFLRTALHKQLRRHNFLHYKFAQSWFNEQPIPRKPEVTTRRWVRLSESTTRLKKSPETVWGYG